MQRYQDSVLQAPLSTPIVGASVQVNIFGGGAATIYSDNGVTVEANPTLTDANGRFSFYAADGRYTLVVSKTGFTTQTLADILLADPAQESADTLLFIPAGTGAVARTVQSKERDIVSAADFALDDGSDQSTQLQQVLTNLGVLGGALYFPTPAVRWAWGTGLKVPYGVRLFGTSPWGCILRYTGTGLAFTADGTNNNNNVAFENFNLQLSGVGAYGFDYSRFLSSTMRDVVITSQAASQRGISANITNTAWNSFFNNFYGVTFNGAFADAVFIDASVAQQANAWKMYSNHFLGCVNSMTLTNLQEIDIYSAHAETTTGDMFKLGANCSRPNIFSARMESVGGNMFAVNDACNRLAVRGIKVLSGTINAAGKWGIRADIDPMDWDNGPINTDAAVTTPTAGRQYLSGVGIQHYGTIGLSSTTTSSKNLRGQVTFTGAATKAVAFANNEPDASYFVAISGNVNETFWVTAKAVGGFTMNSSNAASTAVVDWHLIR